MLLLLVAALVGAFPKRASANGRFPRAQRLLEHPTDPNRLYLTATYGLLTTGDRGRNWYYVCEAAFALKFLEGDPLLEIVADGSLLGGIFDTENRSGDCGCSWRTVLGESASEIVIDMARDRAGGLVAIIRDDSMAASGVTLVESTDAGQTWRKLSDLPGGVTDAFTVDVAPSDPSRIYISAFIRETGAVVLLASKDRAGSWEQLDIPGADVMAQAYIAAVHPTDADRIFVRIDNWNFDAEFTAQDSLLHSNDGGRTWTQVLQRQAKLYGFALSADGKTVLAGYGDPNEAGGRTTNPDDNGIFKASTDDFVFEKIFSATISCLTWNATGVYVCTSKFPGMAVGFAPNAGFTLGMPNPFTPLLDVKDVHGPLSCVASVCQETWTTGLQGTAPVCQVLGADCGADLSRNTPACGPGISDGGSATAGSGGRGGGAGADAAGKSGGCGCYQADVAIPDSHLAWIAVAYFIYRARRTRRESFTTVPTCRRSPSPPDR